MTFASAPNSAAANTAGSEPRYGVALAVTTTIFFMWGFLTSLNDVLIPHFKSVFDLDYTRSMLIQFAFFGAYFVMSLPAGRVVDRLGYRRGIVCGLVVAGLGALLFLPAAQIQSYGLFLVALFVLASGITVLQVAANPYVSLLGDETRASSRLTLAQALNSLGHTIGPAIGGLLILSVAVLGADALARLTPAELSAYRDTQAAAVQLPYLGLALTLFALALFVYLFRLPQLAEAGEGDSTAAHTFTDALRHRSLQLAAIGIFLYVGAEVAIGSFLINYLSLPQIGNLSEASAANYVSYYWGGAMLGRFAGSALLRHVAPPRLLALFAAIAALLLVATMAGSGLFAVVSVVAIGLFNSVMFPTLFTLGIRGLGPLTARGSSVLVMAIVGGAIVPLLMGMLADRVGPQLAFALPLLCYVYLVWYGWHTQRTTADDAS
jgi:FHS family L-fucose permease-like MFS transporter